MKTRALQELAADPAAAGVAFKHELADARWHQAESLQLDLGGHRTSVARQKEGPLVTEDRAEELRQAMFHKVLDEGPFVQFMEGDVASVIYLGQPVAYTVGRTLVGRPEFLATGMPRIVAEALLMRMTDFDDRNPGTTDGQESEVDLGHTLLRVKLIKADTTPLIGAVSLFGPGAVTAFQVLWPREGKYPTWEDQWPEQPIRPYGRTPLSKEDPYA